MDYTDIRNTIERYWRCETEQEEELLIAGFYAQHPTLPDDLEKWRDWFSGMQHLAQLPDEAFEQKILRAIDGGQKKKSFFRTKLLYPISIAASIALLIFIGLNKEWSFFKKSSELTDAEKIMAVKTLLLYTSSEMNRAGDMAKEQLKTASVLQDMTKSSHNE